LPESADVGLDSLVEVGDVGPDLVDPSQHLRWASLPHIRPAGDLGRHPGMALPSDQRRQHVAI
jgi:hypothetical protein